MTELTIALAGNPNTGKSTVFNILTGSRQHVGNWPGKTVEKKEGVFKYNGISAKVVDLPGTYSLSAYSLEEHIARDFIIKEKPDLIINVADAANLERNLYLTTQILETGRPLIILLNMADAADGRGIKIDTEKMSQMLGGIPIIKTAARRNQGLHTLKETIFDFAQSRSVPLNRQQHVELVPEVN